MKFVLYTINILTSFNLKYSIKILRFYNYAIILVYKNIKLCYVKHYVASSQ